MSTIKDIFDGLRTTIELNSKVASAAAAVSELTKEMRGFDRRLVRIETIIEIARPDGAILRLANTPDSPSNI